MPANRTTLTHRGTDEYVDLSLHEGTTGYLWVKTEYSNGPIGFPLNQTDIDELRRTLNRHHRQNRKAQS